MDLTQIDIEQLVSFEGYEYRLSSGNRGLQLNLKTCPRCHNENWKVYFGVDTGYGNCFVCSEGFNPYKFVKFARGMNNHGAVMQYFENHSNVVAYKPKPKVYVPQRLNKDWKLPLNNKILLDEDVPKYLLDRGINAKIAKRFDLRYCSAGFYKYEDHSGTVRNVDFSNRVIIPIYDCDGNPATFQGRDITGTSPRKYLFPNMLPGTARYIYNAKYIADNKKKRVLLNEGVFDVFASTAAIESEVGYKDWGVCGTFGKHFSIQRNTYEAEDQLADLAFLRSQGVEEFCIMWDGESKARKAALEAALRLKSMGFNMTVALGLPDGCDPNECSPKDVLRALDNRIVPNRLTAARMKLMGYV